MIARLAERYGAELVELEHTEQLVDHCSERDLGLAPAVVRSLVPGEPSEAPAGASSPPRTRQAPALLEQVVTVAMVIAALLWYGTMGTIGVFIAVGIIRAIVESPPAEFSQQHLRVVDQALVELDGKLRYVAVVRNTSEKRVALAAFPHGSVTDSTGDRVARLGARGRIESRPSLLPGATGIVVEVLPGRRKTELPARLRYEVEIRARRAPAAKAADPPLELSRLSFDRESCRLAVTADASRPLGGAGIGDRRSRRRRRDQRRRHVHPSADAGRELATGDLRGAQGPVSRLVARERACYPYLLPSQLARETRGADRSIRTGCRRRRRSLIRRRRPRARRAAPRRRSRRRLGGELEGAPVGLLGLGALADRRRRLAEPAPVPARVRRELGVVAQVGVGLAVAAELVERVADREMGHPVAALEAASPCRERLLALHARRGVEVDAVDRGLVAEVRPRGDDHLAGARRGQAEQRDREPRPVQIASTSGAHGSKSSKPRT